MLHLFGFGGAKTDSTNNENVPAVADQVVNTSGNSRFISPLRLKILAGYVANDTITRARITAPSLRQRGLPEIYPVTVADIPATNPAVCYWGDDGPDIQMNEEFGVEASNGASTIDFCHALLLATDGKMPVPAGKRMTIFGSAAVTLVKDAWALASITLDQTLPYGIYAVIGMACKCTAAHGARLVFPRGPAYRPGCVVSPTLGGLDFQHFFRYGNLGEWGRFNSLAQPQVELIGTTAGAQTANLYLDLVQVTEFPMSA